MARDPYAWGDPIHGHGDRRSTSLGGLVGPASYSVEMRDTPTSDAAQARQSAAHAAVTAHSAW